MSTVRRVVEFCFGRVEAVDGCFAGLLVVRLGVSVELRRKRERLVEGIYSRGLGSD